MRVCSSKPRSRHATVTAAAAVVFAIVLVGSLLESRSNAQQAQPGQPAPQARATVPVNASPQAGQARQAVIQQYCIGCHNDRLRTSGLSLEHINTANPEKDAELWEKVLVKLQARSMPPAGRPRPDEGVYAGLISGLESDIDRAWKANPTTNAGVLVHRLNRIEYGNAIRDLFGLEINVAALLPGDETADGSFDNFGDALSISPAHLERYLSVSRMVTRLATGLPPSTSKEETFEVPLQLTQDDRQNEDLPFGSRGGSSVRYIFPTAGDYRIKIVLRRQYQDYLLGMGWPQQLDIRLDGKLLKRFTTGPAPGTPAPTTYAGDGQPGFFVDSVWEEFMQVKGDAHLELTGPIAAGTHTVGVSFVRAMFEREGLPQPDQRGRALYEDDLYMDNAAVGAIQIAGPLKAVATVAKDAPSRRAVFVCEPSRREEERACAVTILSRLARLAYRRPVTSIDVDGLMKFYDQRRQASKPFDDGIQFALERMLVDPDFLLRISKPASAAAAPSSRPADGIELASRLSFFLWSSIPDEPLLDAAARGRLATTAGLDEQARRMMADPKAARALMEGFTAQWLNLRRVEDVYPNPDTYPTFDANLLEAMKTETELFVTSTIAEDRSVRDLLAANYTFINERLATHYGIPGIYGTRFRRVTLPDLTVRGGLLGQASLLATTSYPDRTSPVLRGKWLMDNIVGSPVPAPPPNVNTNLPEPPPGTAPKSIRDRLAVHRTNPSCSTCHGVIDPLGFSLENFDSVGAWRATDESRQPVDAVGLMTSGKTITGLSGLRDVLLEQPSQFPRTVTSKLMAYALGRPLDYRDQPAIRRVVQDAAATNYRWSSLISGIVKSEAFRSGAATPARVTP
jgi:hypothetical protein